MNDHTEVPPASNGEADASEKISSDDEALDERDKTLADSFPASDPPAMP